MTTERIVCGVDFSESSRDAMYAAAELARLRRATLVLAHVAERPLWANAPYVAMPGDIPPETIGAAEAALETWARDAEQHGAPVVITRLASGAVPDELVAIANVEPDVHVIVLGTHGHRGIKRAILGSVAERVVRHAPCSVLVVRHHA